MTLHVNEIAAADHQPAMKTAERFLLVVGTEVEEKFDCSEIRKTIRQFFDLSESLSGVSRKQVVENDDGDMLEIEQSDIPEIIYVRLLD